MKLFLQFLLYPPVFIGLLIIFLYYAFSIYRRLNSEERALLKEKEENAEKAVKKSAELSQLLAWREEELERAKQETEKIRAEMAQTARERDELRAELVRARRMHPPA